MKELICRDCDYSCSNNNCLAKQSHEAFKVLVDYAYKLQKEEKSKNRKEDIPIGSESEDKNDRKHMRNTAQSN